MKFSLHLGCMLHSLFTPITLVHRDIRSYYRKHLRDVGVFLVWCFYGTLFMAVIALVWGVLDMISLVTGYQFIIGISILLSVGTLYLSMYVIYYHYQKTLFSQEKQKGKQILAFIEKTPIPEKIYYIKEYIDHANNLKQFDMFGYERIRKTTEENIRAFIQETHTFISSLSFGLLQNQEYFVLFADINNSVILYGSIESTQYEMRNDRIVIGDIRDQMDAIQVRYIISEFTLHFTSLLGFVVISAITLKFYNDYPITVVSLFIIGLIVFVCSIVFRIYLGLLGHHSIGYIQKQKDAIIHAFRLLSSSLHAFLVYKNMTIALMKSEQGVKGIEPLIVSKIATNIICIMKYWNQYQHNIDSIHKILSDRRGYFLKPKYPHTFIQDILRVERLQGEKDLREFQSHLHDWIQSHTKDLQDYEKELSQIHQSLSQNKSENTEVIDLLEKNFHLHLQSVQKIENSI